jgi:copper chaperone
MAKQVLAVTGMSCNHCKMSVEKAVAAVKGVLKVEADVNKGRVSIDYVDAPGLLDQVRAAITESGYTVAS